METQHRKVTYRMKRRGMYWSDWGAETMSQMILLMYEGQLQEVFFGDWRQEYKKITDLDHLTAETIRQQMNYTEEKDYHIQVQRKACKIVLNYAIMKSDIQRGDKYGIST